METWTFPLVFYIWSYVFAKPYQHSHLRLSEGSFGGPRNRARSSWVFMENLLFNEKEREITLQEKSCGFSAC